MNIDTYNPSDNPKLNLVPLILHVLVIKVVIFLIDPTVMFFIDDSSRYLDTALSSYIPPDRSFVYGFLIRWLTYSSLSLTSVVLFQVLCSAASAVLVGYILNRFLSVKPAIATVFSLLCAVAPLQLLYERYVMTETVSLLFFALFVAIGFCYLRRPKILTLFFLSLSGVLLIAFRFSYLPVVLTGTVIAPGLAIFSPCAMMDGNNNEGSWLRRAFNRKSVIKTCFHIFVSCLFAYGLHCGYKAMNGQLSNAPPAYQYCAGFHLLSSWTPLIENEDSSDPAIAAYSKYYFRFDLKDRFQRINHRWSHYGLVGYMVQFYDSRTTANKAAYEAALRILRRNPLGIIRLALVSYMDYWNITLLKKNLQVDRSIRNYPPELIQKLKVYYHLYGDGLRFQVTPTNKYFFNAIPWFMVIFLLPLIMAVVMLVDKGRRLFPLALLGSFGVLILINSTALIHRITMRFFHPAEWIALIFLGVLLDRIMKRIFLRVG